MMKDYLEGETASSKITYPLPDEWEVHTSHHDNQFLGAFAEPLALDDEALMLQDMLEIAESGGQGILVEGDQREDFINQFLSGGVVGEELTLEGDGGEFSLAEIEGHGAPVLYSGEELTPWEILDGDFIELNDLLFSIDEAPSQSPESVIHLRARQSANLSIQQNEQGRAKRRSMLQMRVSGSGPVPRPISHLESSGGGQSLPPMNLLELTQSSAATAHGSKLETGHHEPLSEERLSGLHSPSFPSEDKVATVDCRLNLQELEDYLITGLLPQSASSDGHTSGTTVDLDSEGGF
jgi:hypothetical protein